MNKNPLVSVIMSTYNPNKQYLQESIESILNQTYSNFEFIIINDGSNEDLAELINDYHDDRIVFINNKKNKGLTKCLNQALEKCKGEFIARMDDDDISLPQRIAKQIEYFTLNPNVNILGFNVQFFGNEEKLYDFMPADSREKQQVELFFDNFGLMHPSVMYRKSFLDEFRITYNEEYDKAEDYGMWVACTKHTKLYCLNEVLLKYRTHQKQASVANRNMQIEKAYQVKMDQVKLLIATPSQEEIKVHLMFCKGIINEVDQLKLLKKWIVKLRRANDIKMCYSKKKFKEALNGRYIELCEGISKENKTIIPILYVLRFLNFKKIVLLSKDKVWNSKKNK